MRASTSCPSLIESLNYSTSQPDSLNISNLTRGDLKKIVKLHDPSLSNYDLKRIANAIKTCLTMDNDFLKKNDTTAFHMGRELKILITASIKYGGAHSYRVEQLPTNRESIHVDCMFCNKTVSNHPDYKVTNTAEKTIRFTPLALHYLQEHGFCGIGEHRVEPSAALQVLDKQPEESPEAKILIYQKPLN